MEKAKAFTESELQQMIAAAIAKHDEDKEAAEIAEEEAHKQALNDAQKQIEEYNHELVTIQLFKDNGKYKDDMVVNVNGKCFLIQRGVEVHVPRFVKNVIDQSLAQDQSTAMMIEKLEDDYSRNPQI